MAHLQGSPYRHWLYTYDVWSGYVHELLTQPDTCNTDGVLHSFPALLPPEIIFIKLKGCVCYKTLRHLAKIAAYWKSFRVAQTSERQTRSQRQTVFGMAWSSHVHNFLKFITWLQLWRQVPRLTQTGTAHTGVACVANCSGSSETVFLTALHYANGQKNKESKSLQRISQLCTTITYPQTHRNSFQFDIYIILY